MGYGVMVTLQILVLSFLVRIQVAQLNDSHLRVVFLLYDIYNDCKSVAYATSVVWR